jgi:2-haloacid dehalogenase
MFMHVYICLWIVEKRHVIGANRRSVFTPRRCLRLAVGLPAAPSGLSALLWPRRLRRVASSMCFLFDAGVHAVPDVSLDEPKLPAPDTVIFDIGGVLIDWNPRYLYRQLFDDDATMERFLAEVCSPDWNEQQDAGRPWEEAIALLLETFPRQASLIRAYRERWDEMLGGALHDTLRQRGVRVFALTNWSHDTFAIARQRYAFLQWFEDIVVSGTEGLIKPDPAIFRRLLQRGRIDPVRAVYIDDTMRHVDAAKSLGMRALLFRDAASLQRELAALGLLPPSSPSAAS